MTNPEPPRTVGGRLPALVRLMASAVVLLVLVAGVPYALTAAVGVPWPDPAISAGDLMDRLSEPVSDPMVVKLLALAGWACWAAFLTTLAREATWTARQLPTLRRDGSLLRTRIRTLPAHRVAAALLIGTLMASWAVAWRPASAHALSADSAAAARPVAYVTAPLTVAASAPAEPSSSRTSEHRTTPYAVAPGDTLWDIAREHLGDPLLWPKIYQLNQGRIQDDGRCLRDPDLIEPGWVLHLPNSAETPASPRRRPGPPAPSTPPHAQITPPQPSPAPTAAAPRPAERQASGQREERERPSVQAPRHHRIGQRPVTIGVGAASAIGITTAAGIAAALAFARAHQRRRRQPDLSASNPPPLAEAVRAANSAHLTVHQAQPVAPHDEENQEPSVSRRPIPAEPGTPGAVMVAARDGHELSLDALAVPGGIAWTGPGADPAARALAIAVLSAAQRLRPDPPHARLLTPTATAARLLPETDHNVPAWTRTSDCNHALDLVEQSLLHHARLADDQDTDEQTQPAPPMDILLTDDDPRSRDRLRAAARRAAPGQLAVIVLGTDDWPQRAHLATDGTITHATGPAAQMLHDVRLFTLTREPAREFLDVLHAAHGHTPSPNPTPPPRTGTDEKHNLAVPAPHPASPEALPEAPPAPETRHRAAEPARDAPEPAAAERPVTVHLLGGFRIHTKGEAGEFGFGLREETREFLAILAAHPRGIRAEEIIEHLRMSTDPEQSARELGNLRRAVRRSLRQATGAHQAAFLVRAGERTRLDPTLVATDVEAFTTAVQQAAAARDEHTRTTALQSAVAAYGGPLCEGADYPWADGLREALHRKAVDALVLLADHTATRHPDPDSALALLDQAADWDPVNEAVYQRIIRLQLAVGRDDAARRTYHLLTRRLADIDATPDPATTALLGRQRHPATSR